ncbi:hypothetical protein JCM14469_27850 [Desulfatiferula olefinivorans]
MTPQALPFERQETLTPLRRLCFIHLPGFVRRIAAMDDTGDFRRRKSLLLTTDGLLGDFFSESDMAVINGFKVLKKQVEWMAGKMAVKRLAETLGLGPPAHVMIRAETGGAPYLPDFPGVSISITHSGDYAAAAMDLTGRNLAVDLEAVEAGRMQTIMRVAFSEREIARYRDSGDQRLYLNWTAKEAFLKYIKKGFAEGLKTVEIIDGKIYHHGRPVTGITVDSRVTFSDYAFTLITETDV